MYEMLCTDGTCSANSSSNFHTHPLTDCNLASYLHRYKNISRLQRVGTKFSAISWYEVAYCDMRDRDMFVIIKNL